MPHAQSYSLARGTQLVELSQDRLLTVISMASSLAPTPTSIALAKKSAAVASEVNALRVWLSVLF